MDFAVATAVCNFNARHLLSDITTCMGIALTTAMKNFQDKKDLQLSAPIKRKMRNKKLEKELSYEKGAYWNWASPLNFRGIFL